jgi:hypothetical protein
MAAWNGLIAAPYAERLRPALEADAAAHLRYGRFQSTQDPMHPDEIYALTPLGQSELRGSATRLTTAKIDVLVRLDGILTLEQLMAGMSARDRASFTAVFRDLRDDKLIVRVEPDPFTSQWNTDMANFTRTVGQGEVDAGLASLQRAGFYVQIAKGRETPRKLPAGGRHSVVVVEDDETLARFTATLLSLSGFDVRQAGNRAAVVAEIRRPPVPDLILLDVVLPDADGFDILMRVRQRVGARVAPTATLPQRAREPGPINRPWRRSA